MANFIDTFKKDDELYVVHAEESVSATTAVSAATAGNVDNIGKVRKYSGNYDGKQREGLQFVNTADQGSEALIELNSKGNFSVESLTKHLNLESAKGVQIKPSTNIILDSTRRIILGKGNEVQVEAKFDDYGDIHGYDGDDEEWAELKINSRNLDLRCHDHGGIALQIAGKDKTGFENKIKFESDRTSPISEQGTYNGEGGKGLEFGTFNNEHSSLFTRDYRFNKYGFVYAVERDTPVYDSGKVDYPTQPDDFKDIINGTTPVTQWKDIVNVSEKYKQLKDFTTESDVQSLITQRAAELASGGSISLDGYATEQYVDDAIAQIETGTYEAGNGVSIMDNVISVNNYSQIEPLTSLTKNLTALSCVKIGKEKGNLKLDVKGKYTYEANVDAVDEFGNEVVKGGRVVNYIDENFYNDPTKYYYKALVNGLTYENVNQHAQKGAIAYKKTVMTSFEPGTYFYVAKKNARMYSAEGEGEVVVKGTIVVQTFNMTSEEIEYYDCVTSDNKWSKSYVLMDSDNESFYENENWEKVPLWIKNEINANIETDSKIKFDGKKIETTWAYAEVEGGEEVDHKMDSIALTTENLKIEATNVYAKKKITKNGDFDEEPILNYVFENKLYDENGNIVVTEAQFITNFKSQHPDTTLTDNEIADKYTEYLLMGQNETVSMKVSELLGLVTRVETLESIVENLTSRIEALEGENQE